MRALGVLSCWEQTHAYGRNAFRQNNGILSFASSSENARIMVMMTMMIVIINRKWNDFHSAFLHSRCPFSVIHNRIAILRCVLVSSYSAVNRTVHKEKISLYLLSD